MIKRQHYATVVPPSGPTSSLRLSCDTCENALLTCDDDSARHNPLVLAGAPVWSSLHPLCHAAAPPASTLGVDSTAEEARRRSEVMVEALGGVAPSCVASLVETVAADVRLNAHTIESLAAGSPALALALTPAAASTLSRATAGLCLLWRLAGRMTSRRAATTEFDASLETIWAASGAF